MCTLRYQTLNSWISLFNINDVFFIFQEKIRMCKYTILPPQAALRGAGVGVPPGHSLDGDVSLHPVGTLKLT